MRLEVSISIRLILMGEIFLADEDSTREHFAKIAKATNSLGPWVMIEGKKPVWKKIKGLFYDYELRFISPS